ncbi:MAG: M15 family metallopeptidase [Erysipelotrichaceae bacterium]|nr:M15 family metallopeptidase [Erysipelotrichaceae bacterium]
MKTMKRFMLCLALGIAMPVTLTACRSAETEPEPEPTAETETDTAAEGIDYLALVNKLNPLPEGWEEALETVTVTNSMEDEVEVEARAYAAYELLKADLEENDGIYTELDSARRSVAAQQEIMEAFTEKYGADYAAKTVAKPGYSEHHTGLALNLYFKIKNDDGSFTDVYYNEDMEKPEYTWIWDRIHEKLAGYGFILRYLEGMEHVTGYRYEPWHIRYVDSAEIAKEIMSQKGLTLEEYLAGKRAPEVEIDLGTSDLFKEEELYDAMLAIKCRFGGWADCELHSIRYGGDEAADAEKLEWLNSLSEDAEYTEAAEFLMDFTTGKNPEDGFNSEYEYKDFQWWLARSADGDWEIVTYGF